MTAPSALPELPLDRLNYYNGQRLEAADLRLEQGYHMRVQRWLNRTLFQPGIGAGLEVTEDPGDAHRVIVNAGLALDFQGREIILVAPQSVLVCGTPRRPDGVTFGNYLVIAYDEGKVAPQQDGCSVQVGSKGAPSGCGCGKSGGKKGACGCAQCRDHAASERAWGAPSRIRAEPLLLFRDTWPRADSGHVLLAQVELDAQCQVIGIKTDVRRYAAPSKPPVVTPVSLEGEKDIDKDNPKVLTFHLEGGYPDVASLYLQGSRFSTLYYTEMGDHGHDVSVEVSPHPARDAHAHTLEGLETVEDGGTHGHDVTAHIDEPPEEADNVLMTDDVESHNANLVTKVQMSISGGGHVHTFPEDATTDEAGAIPELEHDLDVDQSDAGVSDVAARSGTAHTYLKDLQVRFDSVDITAQILAKLVMVNPALSKLGDGQPNHEFNTNGSGRIDLKELDGVDLSPGVPHTLVFSVASGGGQLHYNLYIS